MDYEDLINNCKTVPELNIWAQCLPEQIETGLSHQRYGDLERWLEQLTSLPKIDCTSISLKSHRISASSDNVPSKFELERIEKAFHGLHPWRKGPFEICGIHIDSEWRSDFKWNRLSNEVGSLEGQRVLDVGCGNGYHCWRMLGAGAAEVIGIDPSPLFVVQFWAVQHFLKQSKVWVIPVGIDQVPENMGAFDTVFSMGVIYHRREPLDHIHKLRQCLKRGGKLILETLVIEDKFGEALAPKKRYARMGNVWTIPSCPTLLDWLKSSGFKECKIIDVNKTSEQEQRRTSWMKFQSLSDFLDPKDRTLTVEGYPAPQRAIATAIHP